MHSLTEEEWSEINSGVKDGNPDKNDWNAAVTTRISAYEPSILALDSLVANGDKAEHYPLELKVGLWGFMPDRPSRLNGTDSIYVLGGDNVYGGHYKDGGWDAGWAETAAQVGSFGATLVTATILGGLADEALYGWRRWQKGYDPYAGVFDEERASQVSRRSFFKTLGMGAAFLTLNGSALPSTLATYSPWEPVTDAAKTFTQETEFLHLDRRFGQRVYGDGRTALLIAKTFDALNDIPSMNGRGAVVMGNGHIPFSDEYLEDENARAEVIHQHTEAMLQDAQTKPYYSNESKKTTVADRGEAILDAERKYVLFEVKEPDDKRFQKNPKKEIDRIVQFHGVYTAPSVAKAIGDLKAA